MNRDKTSFLPFHHRKLEAVNFLLLLNGAIQDSVDRGPNKNPKSNFLSEGMLFYVVYYHALMRQLLYFCVTPYNICEMRCNSFKFNV